MKKIIFILPILIFLNAFGQVRNELSGQSQKLIHIKSCDALVITSSTCPIEIVKLAIELNSIELLKTAYSTRMLARLDEIEWEKAFKYWKELGVDDYSCKIDKKESFAIFFHKRKELDAGMRVIKEESGWKFDER